MNAHDSFDWANAGVGGVGLFLTLVAIWQATGAKKAAGEARDAVQRRELSFEMGELVSLTLDLASHVDSDRVEAALIRARDVASRIARDQARFRRYLKRDFGLMLDLGKIFGDIAEQLSNASPPVDEKVALELVNRIHQANRTLNTIYGRLQSGLDEEGT